MVRRPDHQTRDLFAVPTPAAMLPGSLEFGLAVRRLVADAIKNSPLTIYQIAGRMTELIGVEVTVHQLHAWTAPSREGWRFPLEYLPALEAAAETHDITAWLAGVRGGQLHIGRDVLHAELGRLERQRDEAAKRIKALKNAMGEDA